MLYSLIHAFVREITVYNHFCFEAFNFVHKIYGIKKFVNVQLNPVFMDH